MSHLPGPVDHFPVAKPRRKALHRFVLSQIILLKRILLSTAGIGGSPPAHQRQLIAFSFIRDYYDNDYRDVARAPNRNEIDCSRHRSPQLHGCGTSYYLMVLA
jgi:hypothetical protein